MRGSRFVAAVCALVALSGCFGRGGGGPSPSPASSTPQPGERGVDGQRVVFAKGAEVEAGVLVKTCDPEGCVAVPRATPVGRFTVAEPRPILSVTFELVPDAVAGSSWSTVGGVNRRSSILGRWWRGGRS